MKILHTIENYYPSVGGSQEVVRQISERLAKQGHEVIVATSKHPERKSSIHNGVKIVEFDVEGKEAIGVKGRDIERYKSFLLNSDADIIMNYAAQQWATDLMFDVIDRVRQPKILVPCGFSGLYHPAYKEYFKKMPARMKKYNASVYLSNDYRDINFARKHGIKNCHLIPNGAGKDEFEQKFDFVIRNKLHIPKKSFLILTVGSHTGLKGHAEAIEIFENSKISNATLLIIANDFGDGCAEACKEKMAKSKRAFSYFKSRKRLLVKELSRAQTVAAYKEADLFLFPSNVEASPLVLFEAMASKLPFLANDVGNTKEIIKWSKGGLLLPTQIDVGGYSHAMIDESARLIENLYAQPAERDSLSRNGYSTWRKKFTWEIITRQYEKLYERFLPS